ncbi:flagellar biosynthetic protein FliO [Exiguobacterium artemiae]|uniref:flagellar biosynthetic protein FliO n=1 Tax=Exiguobacterium artemiae TaxID=340145 RepID=UPI002963D847|nr:flagellar biosynthetic protein FliO [Exiguobacterium sibiricum]MDW2884904.1 flagellar biosynthetic protein FliO [Exiguobacterium sibiricum]
MRRLTCLTCLLLFLLTHPVGAETVEEKLNPSKNNEPTTQQVDGSSTVVTVVKIVVTLAVLIGGFLLAVRFINERTKGVRQSSRLSHLGGVPLGKDRSVQLVRVHGKIYVVGVGQNVELLDTIEEDDEWLATDTSDSSAHTSTASPFLESFKQQLDQFQKKRGRS